MWITQVWSRKPILKIGLEHFCKNKNIFFFIKKIMVSQNKWNKFNVQLWMDSLNGWIFAFYQKLYVARCNLKTALSIILLIVSYTESSRRACDYGKPKKIYQQPKWLKVSSKRYIERYLRIYGYLFLIYRYQYFFCKLSVCPY